MCPDKPLGSLTSHSTRIRSWNKQDIDLTWRSHLVCEVGVDAKASTCCKFSSGGGAGFGDVGYFYGNGAGDEGRGEFAGFEVVASEHAEEVDACDVEELDGREKEDCDACYLGRGGGW